MSSIRRTKSVTCEHPPLKPKPGLSGPPAIGYDTEADRSRYFVTDSGITVVTRDYSLFDNPVTVDYFTSE